MKNVRIVAGAALAIMFVSLWGSAASAHVTVQPNTAEQGARGRFVFRVPNESATASTVRLAVQMPKDAPTATSGIRVMPKTGWDVEIEKAALDTPVKIEDREITEYVSRITWTAQPGVKIEPDRFEEFDFTTGALPKDRTTLAFKAVQGYDGPLADGTSEVNWVEERKEGEEDPDRPEPLVKLTPATTPGAATAQAGPAEAATGADVSAAAASTAAADAKSAADSARNIGIFGLLIGIVALLVAAAAVATRPRAGGAAGGGGSNGTVAGTAAEAPEAADA